MAREKPKEKYELSFTSSRDCILLKVNSTKNEELDGLDYCSLEQLCRITLPECRLSPFLFNGHIQTISTLFYTKAPAISYKRKIFEAELSQFSGSFTLDFVVRCRDYSIPTPLTVGENSDLPPLTTYFSQDELDKLPSFDTRPLVLLMHGLTGGSHEAYVRHVIGAIGAGTQGSPWEACVLNARACGFSALTSEIVFNARSTWDLRQTLVWLRKTFPRRPLFAIAFSLGANVLVNYLAEAGSESLLHAAIVFSNPWNLEMSYALLKKSLFCREIYLRSMGGNMRDLFVGHLDQLSKIPGFSSEKFMSITYLDDFDRVVQCALWGYPSETAYYRDASCIDTVLAVRTPLLAVNALDDPLIDPLALPKMECLNNPYVVLCTTQHGGHLGWYTSESQTPWYAIAAAKFLHGYASIINLDAPVQLPKVKTITFSKDCLNSYDDSDDEDYLDEKNLSCDMATDGINGNKGLSSSLSVSSRNFHFQPVRRKMRFQGSDL